MSNQIQPDQTPNDRHTEPNTVTNASDNIVGRDKHVYGDEVRGDKFTGDKVMGDKQVIIQQLDPANAYNQRIRQKLLQLVYETWIEGYFSSSLYTEVPIKLHKVEKPDAVDNRRWDMAVQMPNKPARLFSIDTEIIEIFEEVHQSLLILGTPGSGKTTVLLELAQEMINRAEKDSMLHIPVIFHLSSWEQQPKPLDEWLIHELSEKYYISWKVADTLIEDDKLMLLLDGLDEIILKAQREQCVESINTFRQKHDVPLIVCSRIDDYEILEKKLRLQSAVLLKPLTPDQINRYFDQKGDKYIAVREALQQNNILQELLESPLMLTVVALAHQGSNVYSLGQYSSIADYRHYLFDTYVQHMFERRRPPKHYGQQQTIRYLSWLAFNMFHRQQSIFLIERLQPNWLQTPVHVWFYRVTFWLIVALIFGLPFYLIGGSGFGLIGLLIGVPIGRWNNIENTETVEKLAIDRQGLIDGLKKGGISGLGIGLGIGLIAGFVIGLLDSLIVGLLYGLTFSLVLALVIGLETGLKLKEIPQNAYPNQGIWRSAGNMLISGLIGGLVGFMIGLVVFGLVGGIIIGLGIMLVGGLIGGGIICIQHLVLRIFLWRQKCIPWNYVQFLKYCYERVFIRQVGGGYIFIHRMLMEHFANMTDEDIERIAREVEAGRRSFPKVTSNG